MDDRYQFLPGLFLEGRGESTDRSFLCCIEADDTYCSQHGGNTYDNPYIAQSIPGTDLPPYKWSNSMSQTHDHREYRAESGPVADGGIVRNVVMRIGRIDYFAKGEDYRQQIQPDRSLYQPHAREPDCVQDSCNCNIAKWVEPPQYHDNERIATDNDNSVQGHHGSIQGCPGFSIK